MIGIFLLSLSKGGSEKQALLLSDYLKIKNKTHLIVFSETKEIHPILSQLKIKPYYLTGNIFSKVISLFKFLRREKITHLFNYLPSNNIIGSLVGNVAGVKYIFGGIRGTKIKSPGKMLLMKFVFNNVCTKVISNSNAAKNIYVKRGIIANKIIVIPNGVKIPQKKLLNENKNEIIVLSVGRFIEEKDFGTAIDSIALVLDRLKSSNYKLIYKIVGYGHLKEQLKSRIEDLNLNEIVHLYDETENITNFYQEADIYLSTSTHEGMSNTIMEALTYSLPVVCTNVGDSSSLVIDGYNGFLCQAKDLNRISESLYKLITDNLLRLDMSGKAYEHISSNYSVEKSFAKYVDLIQEYAVEK